MRDRHKITLVIVIHVHVTLVINFVVRYNAIELHTKQYFCRNFFFFFCNELRGFEGRNMMMFGFIAILTYHMDRMIPTTV